MDSPLLELLIKYSPSFCHPILQNFRAHVLHTQNWTTSILNLSVPSLNLHTLNLILCPTMFCNFHQAPQKLSGPSKPFDGDGSELFPFLWSLARLWKEEEQSWGSGYPLIMEWG
jgi:hypothetical protein